MLPNGSDFNSKVTKATPPTDHKPQFTDPAVQDILTRITRLDMQKVFRITPENPKPPIYKLMTDEQLKQVLFTSSTITGPYHTNIHLFYFLPINPCVVPGCAGGIRGSEEANADASCPSREEAHQ